MAVRIVPRNKIEMITEVVENGQRHFLGEVRDFRRHPTLAEFIPESAPHFGISWVRLGPGEVLAPHRHPADGLLVCVAGSGFVVGDTEAPIEVGDAVLVDAGSCHGFKGGEPDGIEGLSMAFGVSGYYTDLSNPQVRFEPT